MRILIAVPIFNERKYVSDVLAHIYSFHPDVLAIDDGSSDGTSEILQKLRDDGKIALITHTPNQGYGQSLIDAFDYADRNGYDWVITMDCDEQHEPAGIPAFLEAAAENRWDIISGSRYACTMCEATTPPPDRRAINATITQEVNERLGLSLTDAFCGFKAHRVSALKRICLTETGYAFPMQFWVQMVAQGLRVTEIPVKLIYKDMTRSFGGNLDDPQTRLAHYRRVLHCELKRNSNLLPREAIEGLVHSPCSESEDAV